MNLGTLNVSDSVFFAPTFASFPAFGMTGILYIDQGAQETYLWDGSSYDLIGGGGGSLASTDDLPEGFTNLYYTDTRASTVAITEISFHTGRPDPHPQYALDTDVPIYFEEQMVFQLYQVNEVDDTGSGTTYVGKEKTDGKWLIEKVVESGADLQKRYANESNNSSYTTFSDAWTDRLTLTYDRIGIITGL